MREITQIQKLSLWIFFIPLFAINLCLFISVNFEIFDNTFLSVDQIGRSQPTFPYFKFKCKVGPLGSFFVIFNLLFFF